jgi:RHS repeat-associated protein
VTDTIFGAGPVDTSYTYDGLSRMASVAQSGTGVDPKLVDFLYNDIGQFSQIDRYADLQRTSLVARSSYSYDDLHRLTALTHGSAANPRSLAFYDYEYDAASRITAITDVDGRTDYRYDQTNQLTGAFRGQADPRGNESYEYDANGNRIQSHLASSYTTGKANRLLSDGTYNYEYDGEGNMSRRTEIATGVVRDFTWDHRNRLVRVTDKSAGGIITNEAMYTYDALNRRIAKTVDADGTGPKVAFTEHYVYDGQHIVLEFVDNDGPGAAQQPVLSVRNLFGPRVDMILAQEEKPFNRTNWLFSDHQGTVRDVAAGSSDVLNHIRYDQFGGILSQSNPSAATRYAFTGRELDPNASLYYYRARYYDPQLGRFVSNDPLGLVAGANLFAYASNDITRLTDPSGMAPGPTASTRITKWLAETIGNFALGKIPLGPKSPFNAGDATSIPHLYWLLESEAAIELGIRPLAERIVNMADEAKQLAGLIDAYDDMLNGNTCFDFQLVVDLRRKAAEKLFLLQLAIQQDKRELDAMISVFRPCMSINGSGCVFR